MMMIMIDDDNDDDDGDNHITNKFCLGQRPITVYIENKHYIVIGTLYDQ